MKIKLILIVSLFFITSIYSQKYPKREFRAVWVATVANIDWPSSKNATSGEQIRELVEIFDKLEDAGMNAIIFQVRTECDALYKSEFEPWSYWLTGEQGKAPEPFFDPLEFAVDEAHSRGMELHAWFNPYRAEKNVGDYELSENHVVKKHPDWIIDFGNYQMLDPGVPAVKDFIASIIADVVRRYDVDGIHFDDYFYPYSPRVSSEDSVTFAKYNNGYDDVDDWRRYNINSMVAQCYDSINAINPNIKFGISPFGIVKNKFAGTDGFESYDILYCDPQTWIKDKTVDYVTPQLYWHIGRDVADYKALLPWWALIVEDRHLYIGHFTSRFTRRKHEGSESEMGDQIRMNRDTENVLGSIHFSARSLVANSGAFTDTLKNDLYKYPALLPLMEWKDQTKPEPVNNLSVIIDSVGRTISWEAADAENKSFVVYRFKQAEEIDLSNPANIIKITNPGRKNFRDISPMPEGNVEYVYAVTAIDRLNNESDPEEASTADAVEKPKMGDK